MYFKKGTVVILHKTEELGGKIFKGMVLDGIYKVNEWDELSNSYTLMRTDNTQFVHPINQYRYHRSWLTKLADAPEENTL